MVCIVLEEVQIHKPAALKFFLPVFVYILWILNVYSCFGYFTKAACVQNTNLKRYTVTHHQACCPDRQPTGCTKSQR